MGARSPKKPRDSGPRLVQSRTMPRWATGRALASAAPSQWRRRLEAAPALLAMLVLFGGAAYLAARLDPLPPRFVGAAQATDGDSLRLRGDRVRLLGIDAPELDQVCWDASGAEWSCGRSARDRLAALVARGATSCQPHGQDKYGRTLAVCVVGKRDLGATLVAEGMAIAKGDYDGEQAAARAAGLGIWRGRFVDPRQWRDEGPVNAPLPSPFEQVWDWFRELTGATTLR